MKNASLIVFFCLGLSSAWSQTEKEIDSLKQLLKVSTSVEESVAINEMLFEAYLYDSPDSASPFRENIKTISIKNNYSNGLYLYHSLSGRYHFATSNLDSAFSHIESASKVAEELQNKSYLADCYKKIGVIYNIRGVDSLSKKYGLLALANAKQTDDWRTLSSIYVLLGNRSFQRTEYPDALSYYLKLDSIYSSRNELDRSLAASYANIGMIYSELKNPEAVTYIEKSIDVYRTLGMEEGVSYGEVALGTYYDLAKQHRQAIEHLLKAVGFYESYGDTRMLGSIYRRLGSCYMAINDYENAEIHLLKADKFPNSSQYGESKASFQTNLGELYLHKKEFRKAILHFNMALENIEGGDKDEVMPIHQKTAYQGLYEAYKENNDYSNALSALEKQMELEAKIQKNQNQLEVEELNKKYQSDKQQQEISLLTSQAQLAAQKSENQRNLFLAGLTVLGLAFITLFFLFRNKQKTNKRLRELEAAKSKFFANISHEFRTPLTLISGPVAHQLSREDLSSDDKTDLGLIQRNADRLLKYVDQILDLSKIEAGNRKLRVSKGNLSLFLKHLLEPFQYQATKKGVLIEDNIEIPNEVWFDRDVLEKIVTNLLSNALKYNQNDKNIGFEVITQGEQLILTVSNQNQDLTEKEIPQLFDRFYQYNGIHQGFGIGLSLVRELAILSHGSARAHKPNDSTIAFVVSLPITKSAFSKGELILGDEIGESASPSNTEIPFELNTEEEEQENSLPVLLVVDDNAEIRLFIKSLLKKEYQILEADNGEKGLKIALETIPDLIVSDIMMPVKDGIAMSDSLKKDERTSHVPIILLTAKSGEDNELTGLKAGADAYMVKPFKEEKLRVVIEKLIATRTAIQEKFSKQSILGTKGVSLTKVDTRLMERIQQILEVELTNPEFSVASFSEQVGLSRMHLHRKLKALTGLSTSEFLRAQRLKLAAKLLKEGHTNIAEVGYATGFNQPAYFSTAFKQYFGCSPTEYLS